MVPTHNRNISGVSLTENYTKLWLLPDSLDLEPVQIKLEKHFF